VRALAAAKGTTSSLCPNRLGGCYKWCQDNWQCSNNSGECKCKISLGFGENTLNNTVEYLKEKNPHEIAKKVDKSLINLCRMIGERLHKLL
jgi:hypothetical protein